MFSVESNRSLPQYSLLMLRAEVLQGFQFSKALVYKLARNIATKLFEEGNERIKPPELESCLRHLLAACFGASYLNLLCALVSPTIK